MTLPEQTQTEQTANEQPHAEELVQLNTGSTHFRMTENHLEIKRESDDEWREVTLARLFPLSDPEEWISVIDKEDKEIGVLTTLHSLSKESLQNVRKDLHQRYMIPQILRITACNDRFDLLIWEVETNRGPGKIVMRHPQENIKQPLPGRYCMTDVEGNRYDILDFDALDEVSQQLLLVRL